MSKITVAVGQIDIDLAQPETNYARVHEMTVAAARAGADVVVFPEMWNTGYALKQLPDLADFNGQRTLHQLRTDAKEFGINIVGGSVATARDGKFYNTTYVVNSAGQLVGSYDKVHLFGLMDEGQYITAGDRGNAFDLAGVASASAICYDLRFPEWLRTISRHGAQVLYLPAEWPDVRIPQWEALLRARAIENQQFVVAVNRVGHDDGNRFNGHSLVVDPLGRVLINAGEQANLTFAQLDLDEAVKVRGPIPVFKDRRPSLYR